ncbi:MAG: efflux RND transporter periplasmic adaptor subunit [Lentisphaeria bacterium]|nr:efflux RND transporter periplasmic adaptor subunit [Lentisphaeria bacterium]
MTNAGKITLSAVAFCTAAVLWAAPQMSAPKAVVTVDKVTLSADKVNRRYSGRVAPIFIITSVARVSGDLIHQGFKDGDMVKKGQLLFAFDDVRYRAAVDSARAKIQQIKAQLAYAEKNFNRNDALYRHNAVSQDAKENAEENVNGLKAQLLAAEAALVLAEDDLKNTKIYAQVDGKTGKAVYAPGNYITPGSGKLVDIVSIDPIRVRFSISQRDFLEIFGNEDNLKKQAVVKLNLPDGTVYDKTGKIVIVDNQTLNSTDSIRVWALFDNPDNRLIPNAALTCSLSKSDAEMCAAVRPSAVMHDRKGAYVYVVDEANKVARRNVLLGNTDGELQIIRQGLKPGEVVIIEGMHKTAPEDEVKAVSRQQKVK